MKRLIGLARDRPDEYEHMKLPLGRQRVNALS